MSDEVGQDGEIVSLAEVLRDVYHEVNSYQAYTEYAEKLLAEISDLVRKVSKARVIRDESRYQEGRKDMADDILALIAVHNKEAKQTIDK